MDPTQADRRVILTTPLGDDKLLFRQLSGTEQLGRMFRYDVQLLSADPNIKLSDLLGHPVTVGMTMPEDKTRYFNGYVTSFAHVGRQGRFAVYNATLRPWLWFLSRTADSRIFPEKDGKDTVPGIILSIFREHGFSDFEDKLQRTYKQREHCVQYRETDFNFVMRLMEDEGIYFWFKHEDGKHTMVLCDDYGSHEGIPDYDTLPFFPDGNVTERDREHIVSWSARESVQAGMVALDDYDFMRPKADLQVKSKVAREHEFAEFEMFDYPGEYVDPADGEKGDKDGNDDLKTAFEQFAKTRIEELQASYEIAEGQSNARGLFAGGLFSLEEHPRDDQNREYLIESVTIELSSDDYGSEGGGSGAEFSCSLTSIDAKTPFRSQRLTAKPAIHGIQTAIITGPSGETIHTDQYGRVKVQFHWDRYNGNDENSSCWVRVSQNRAGANWGDMQLPHVGQEVIVSFLEGDPDRPIVVGRVYNEDNMPPLPLPEDKVKTVIRDHFGNQIVMDATPGDEHILIHSPHHQSSMEIGKSISWKSEEGLKLTTTENWIEGSLGYKAVVTVGGKLGFTVGHNADITLGYKYSYYKGAQESYTSADAIGTTKGNRVSYTKGVSVSHNKAAELKINESNFAQRSNNDMTLDTLKTMCINAGDKDNSIVKMDKTAILLDFGEDGAAAPSADQTIAAMDAANAIRDMVSKKSAGYATLAATALTVDAVANLADSDRDKKLPAGWDIATMLGGAVGIGVAGLMWKDQRAQAARSKQIVADAVADSSSVGSKNEQDKTFARVKLHADGIQIAAFQAGDPNGTPDAEVTVNTDGTVVINSQTKIHVNAVGDNAEIVVDAEKDISVTANGALNLTGKGVTIDGGSSEVKISGSKVIANNVETA